MALIQDTVSDPQDCASGSMDSDPSLQVIDDDIPVELDDERSGPAVGKLLDAKPKPAPRQPVHIVDAVKVDATVRVEADKRADFNVQTFAVEKLRCTDKSQFKFPWERGTLKRIFGGQQVVPNKKLAVQPSDRNSIKVSLEVGDKAKVSAAIEDVVETPSASIYMMVVKTMEQLNYKEDRAKKRTAAVREWWKLISTELDASCIGRKVLEEAPGDHYDSYGVEVVDACFGLKSPGTLQKRLYALRSFSEWCSDHLGVPWLPLTESHAWQYIRHLKSIGAPATKAATFMEAVRFGWYIVGLDGGDEVQASLRSRGLSAQLFAAKRPWKPADLLTTEEILKLHSFLEDTTKNIVDRVMAGHLLHMLYVRARWSDLLSVRNAAIDVDGVFFEMETRTHKGAKGAESKSKLLPLAAPCVGINGKSWAALYSDARTLAGLDLPRAEDTHMLPAPSSRSSCEWTSRPLTSEEGANFLRRILGVPKSGERRVSTHSLKSTAISWTAKYGLNFEARALLARHSSSVSNPTAMYSRDLLSPVLRSFINVIEQIHSGQFAPDRTRSGMMTPRPLSAAVPATPPTDLDKVLAAEGLLVERTGDVPLSGITMEPEDAAARWRAAVSRVDMESTQSMEEAPPEDGDHEHCDDWSETSESADDSSDSDSGLDESVVDFHQRFAPVSEPSLADVYVNINSTVLHCVGPNGKFKCGRAVSKSYSKVWEMNGIRCSKCFNI